MYKKYTIRANIHTLEIRTDEKVDVSARIRGYAIKDPEKAEAVNRCIEGKFTRGNQNAEKNGRYFILNLNKWDGNNIYFFSEFVERLKDLEEVLHIKNKYKITRFDLKFDSSDPESYEENSKLFRLLMALLAEVMNVRNYWKAEDGATLEQRSIRLNSCGWDLEYYNKAIESNGEDEAKARLELRLMDSQNGFEDLQKAIEARMDAFYLAMVGDDGKFDVDRVYQKANEALLKYWKTGRYRTMQRFLAQERFQEILFTRRQLIILLNKMVPSEKRNGNRWIDKYCKTHGSFGFVQRGELAECWESLLVARDNYFAN